MRADPTRILSKGRQSFGPLRVFARGGAAANCSLLTDNVRVLAFGDFGLGRFRSWPRVFGVGQLGRAGRDDQHSARPQTALPGLDRIERMRGWRAILSGAPPRIPLIQRARSAVGSAVFSRTQPRSRRFAVDAEALPPGKGCASVLVSFLEHCAAVRCGQLDCARQCLSGRSGAFFTVKPSRPASTRQGLPVRLQKLGPCLGGATAGCPRDTHYRFGRANCGRRAFHASQPARRMSSAEANAVLASTLLLPLQV